MALQLSDWAVEYLAQFLPDPVVGPKGGRPALDKRQALRGIFWILDNGAKWKSLPKSFGAKSSVHKYFQQWVRQGVFEKMLQHIARRVEEQGTYRLYECSIDATFVRARGGGDGIGPTKSGKGVKIMILVDARGLPVSVSTASATPHESQLVQRLFDFMLTQDLPEKVIGDKAYDSDGLDRQLAEKGIELIAPHRSHRKPENHTQDGRKLRRYARRWTVEQTISWLHNLRRLTIRYEQSAAMFAGMLHLGCAFMIIQQVYG